MEIIYVMGFKHFKCIYHISKYMILRFGKSKAIEQELILAMLQAQPLMEPSQACRKNDFHA